MNSAAITVDTTWRAADSLVDAAVSAATPSARREDGIVLPGTAAVAAGEAGAGWVVGVAGSVRSFGRFF